MENNSLSQTLAGSPTLLPPNSFRFWPTLFAFLGFIVLLFGVMAVGIGYYLSAHGFDFPGLQRAATGPFGVALQGIAEIIVIAYLLIVLPRLAKRSLGEIGFRSLRAGDGLPSRSESSRWPSYLPCWELL